MTSLAVSEGVASPRASAFADRVLGFVERSHLRACALLVLLALACFLPGFSSLQPMDRDEPRFAQATKQMLETGDFVDIRFQDEARHKKPVGIYWMQAATVAAGEALGIPQARTRIGLYRLPSLAGALATVLLTYWAALAFVGRRGAFAAAALMAGSILLMVEARLAKTDAVLAACSVAAMGALARAYLGRGQGILPKRTVAIFWLAVAVGILVKGPLVLMFAGLPALVLSLRERSGRWLLALRPGWGVPAVLLVVLPWFAAITIKSGGEFFAASVGEDMLAKVGSGREAHGAPPGFYLLAFWATFWPGAVLAGIAIPFAWTNRREDLVAFILAWVVPAWLIFELVPTKLPHYVLPLYPAIAILAVLGIARGFVGPHRPGTRWGTLLLPLIPLGLTAGLILAFLSLERKLPYAALPLLLAASVVAALAWRAFVRGNVRESALHGVLASVALAIGVFGFAQPMLSSLKLSPRLARLASGMSCPEPRFASVGYREPSLVFLVGTRLELLGSGADAARFLSGGSCRMAFVEGRFEPDFQKEAAALGVRTGVPSRVRGFNINGGRMLDIGAYAARP
jgi:4-amino-4-deoxy-L-arabinose transferase-like glycosyltransferase